MKVVYGTPWFLFLIRLRGMAPSSGAIYTWGDTVYTPGPLTGDLIVHEKTHSLQQQGFLGAWRWWFRYLFSPAFRLDQELEAYAAQARYIRDRVPRRIMLKALWSMADTLASPMYALQGVWAGTRKAQPLTDAEAFAKISDALYAPKSESTQE